MIGLWLSWGLWGLYACSVRRLRTEKRNAAHFLGFIGFIGLLRSCICLLWFVLCCCLVCFAAVVCGFLLGCGLGCWVFFFPSDGMTKERAHRVGASPLCSLVVVIRLLIVRGLPAIPFQPLRGLVRSCSNVGGLRHNRGTPMR